MGWATFGSTFWATFCATLSQTHPFIFKDINLLGQVNNLLFRNVSSGEKLFLSTVMNSQLP
jgi:hypothetical protein